MVQEYPEGWKLLKRPMETILCAHWETTSESLGRETYVDTYRKVLLNFLEEEAFEAVESSVRGKTKVPLPMLNKLLSTHIGSYIYAEQAQTIQWDTFLTSIVDGIKNLMHHDFLPSEVTAFTTKMRKETKALSDQGLDALEKGDVSVAWLGFKMPVPVIYIDDFWEAPLYAAKVNCAINAGLTDAAPWDELLMDGANIAGYPVACHVHADELQGINRVRNKLLEHIGEQSTLDTWKKTMIKHGENLKSVMRWFQIDLLSIENHC